MRLGINICEPHVSRGCRSQVNSYITSNVNMPQVAQPDTSLSMMLSAGHLLLLASQQRRSIWQTPGGSDFVPWQSGKPLTWDVTVVQTLADWYVSQTSRSAGAAAERAASRKSAKYADLLQSHLFQPIAVETSGSMDSFTATFFTDLDRKISSVSGRVREAFFLFQLISVSVQRFNSAVLRDSIASTDSFED